MLIINTSMCMEIWTNVYFVYTPIYIIMSAIDLYIVYYVAYIIISTMIMHTTHIIVLYIVFDTVRFKSGRRFKHNY